MMQPFAQLPGTHVGGGVVEKRKECGCGFAGNRFGDFQVAARGGIHANEIVIAIDAKADDMRQGAALRRLHILKQRASSGDRNRHVFAAEAFEIAGAELFGEQSLGGIEIELPIGHASRGRRLCREVRTFRHHQFGRLQAFQLCIQLRYRRFHDAKPPARQR